MATASKTRLLRSVAWTLAAGLVVAATFGAPARADDDDTSFEERILRGLLGGMGVDTGRARIEYRERSPLVLPPSTNLPPPDTTAVVNNPAWPKDPDVVQRKKSSTKPRPATISELGDPGRPLTPQELNRGAVAGAGRVNRPGEAGPLTEADVGRPLRPSELGYKGGLFGSLFKYKEEEVKFDGEPARTSLTQPPPGYMTPSRDQPYGVGNRKHGDTRTITRIRDRAVGGD